MNRPALAVAVTLALSVSGVAHAQTTERFEVVARGPVVQASIGMSRAGYRLFGDLGMETVGMRTFGRRWILGWDLGAMFSAGAIANREPYSGLVGLKTQAMIEPVYRLMTSEWSPVLGARLGADASVRWKPGLSLDDLRTVNDLDGVGGVTARGLVRLGAGASFLDRTRSLLVLAFVQEAFQSHGLNADGTAFTDVGAALRFDWTWGLSLAVEASAGTTLVLDDPALQRSYRTSRLGVGGNARKVFDNGMWLGLFVSLAHATDHVTYEATGTRFDPAGPADFTLGAAFGVSLWRSR